MPSACSSLIQQTDLREMNLIEVIIFQEQTSVSHCLYNINILKKHLSC